MQSLQEYINESQIYEGKMWDKIKQWFNNLFDDSVEKEYDRYHSQLTPTAKTEYKNYLLSNFNKSNIEIQLVNPSNLKKLIEPAGEKPSKTSDVGFWEFIDDLTETHNENIKYYSFIYIDDKIKDTVALLKVNTNVNIDTLTSFVEIKKIQINPDLKQFITLKEVIDIIYKFGHLKEKKGMFILKETNKDLYEKLVNDCDFEKTTINGKTNLAKREK